MQSSELAQMCVAFIASEAKQAIERGQSPKRDHLPVCKVCGGKVSTAGWSDVGLVLGCFGPYPPCRIDGPEAVVRSLQTMVSQLWPLMSVCPHTTKPS